MKTELTKEQSAHLIDLGVPKEKASKCIIYHNEEGEQIGSDEIEWAEEDGYEIEESLIDKDYPDYDHSYENDVPIFTLTDILEILPKEIENRQCISIDWNFLTEKWGVDYEYIDNSYHSAEELIDALYELLCWVIENNYLKTE